MLPCSGITRDQTNGMIASRVAFGETPPNTEAEVSRSEGFPLTIFCNERHK